MSRVFTGERLETNIYNDNSVKHLHRYAVTTKYIHNKIILDIASGEGYGSNLMSDFASFVYGVDIELSVVVTAGNKYNKGNLKFLQGSTSNIPLGDNSIDVVVSFETLEHHDEHEKMFSEIKRVLRPEGILIISTPDKYYYSDKRNYSNEFHVKELYKTEFIQLISANFKKHEVLSQSYLNNNSLIFEEVVRNNMAYYSGDFNGISEVDSSPHFLIAVASDYDFPNLGNSMFEGEKILSKNFIQGGKIDEIYRSSSYRLGHLLLLPFKRLKRFYKKLNTKK
ncbi:class I SAM-dependent methyltransferase [Aequorivita flava]|uniref:Class I SAM-dependent methyltransferase n=1 Tax=Aequorivita flava TaxID=3114371 RepID=A0AB35YRS8_9FLAO